MLKRFFHNHWQEFFKTPPDHFDVVPLTSCREAYGNDLVLIFTGDAQYPNYIFKICRDSKFSFKLEREYLSLQALKNISDLQSYLPTPIYKGEWQGRLFFIQKGLKGASLFKLIKVHGINSFTRRQIHQSISLLSQINKSLQQLPAGIYLPEVNNNVMEKYYDNFLGAGLSESRIKDLARISSMFQGQNKKIFTHGDYWPSNIIVNEEEKKISGIIDWEFASVNSAIPTDIIWFLINLAYCIYKKNTPQSTIVDAFKWAFFSTGNHNKLFVDCFRQYSTATMTNIRSFSDLLQVTLTELSVRELSTYGKHSNMDHECRAMLIYSLDHHLSPAFQ